MKTLLLEQCSSTNDVAWEQMQEDGVLEPVLVIARRQSAGRGRIGRVWNSDHIGNLYCSLLTAANSIPTSDLSLLPLMAGICAMRSLQNLNISTEPLRLKWPNDIVTLDLNHKKLSGFLVETRFQGSRCLGVVLGWGLNVFKTPTIAESERICASLQELVPLPENLELINMAHTWSTELLKMLNNYASNPIQGRALLRDQWLQYSKVKQQPFILWKNNEPREILDLTLDGRLLLKNPHNGQVSIEDQAL